MLESNDDDAHGLICLCVGEKSGGGEEREDEKMSEVNFPAASHTKNDNAENGCPAGAHAREPVASPSLVASHCACGRQQIMSLPSPRALIAGRAVQLHCHSSWASVSLGVFSFYPI
jgi:hypothetical protein